MKKLAIVKVKTKDNPIVICGEVLQITDGTVKIQFPHLRNTVIYRNIDEIECFVR